MSVSFSVRHFALQFFGFTLLVAAAASARVPLDGSRIVDAREFTVPSFHTQTRLGTSLAVGDFDGNGRSDLAVGLPGLEVNGVSEAGGVVILYDVSPDGWDRSELIHQDVADVDDEAEFQDRFGSVLAAGDFRGDGADDLIVGVPGEDLSGDADAGLFHLFNGWSGYGVLPGSEFSFGAESVGDQRQAGAQFARALAVGDFDGDGRDDLAVGSPYRNVGAAGSAGKVVVMFGGEDSLGASGALIQIWSQLVLAGFNGGIDTAESYDTFGWSLATGDVDKDGKDDLVVGAPGESGLHSGSGAAHVIFGWDLGLTGIGTLLLTHDVQDFAGFGYSVAIAEIYDGAVEAEEIVAGAPFRTSDGYDNAGSVCLFALGTHGVSDCLETSQADVGGEASEGAEFGSALTVGDLDGDGTDDLAIAASGQEVEEELKAGAVSVLFGSGSATSVRTWDRSSPGVLGDPGYWARFGSALAALDFGGESHALVVGIPFDDVEGVPDTGALQIFFQGSLLIDGFESGDLSAWNGAEIGM